MPLNFSKFGILNLERRIRSNTKLNSSTSILLKSSTLSITLSLFFRKLVFFFITLEFDPFPTFKLEIFLLYEPINVCTHWIVQSRLRSYIICPLLSIRVIKIMFDLFLSLELEIFLLYKPINVGTHWIVQVKYNLTPVSPC